MQLSKMLEHFTSNMHYERDARRIDRCGAVYRPQKPGRHWPILCGGNAIFGWRIGVSKYVARAS